MVKLNFLICLPGREISLKANANFEVLNCLSCPSSLKRRHWLWWSTPFSTAAWTRNKCLWFTRWAKFFVNYTENRGKFTFFFHLTSAAIESWRKQSSHVLSNRIMAWAIESWRKQWKYGVINRVMVAKAIDPWRINRILRSTQNWFLWFFLSATNLFFKSVLLKLRCHGLIFIPNSTTFLFWFLLDFNSCK